VIRVIKVAKKILAVFLMLPCGELDVRVGGGWGEGFGPGNEAEHGVILPE